MSDRLEPPTLHRLGFEWDAQGDDNRNAAVQVSYRHGLFSSWKKALPVLRIKSEETGAEDSRHVCGHLFAGSILDLRPNTAYKIKRVMTDPDGGGAARVVAVRTRGVPKAFEVDASCIFTAVQASSLRSFLSTIRPTCTPRRDRATSSLSTRLFTAHATRTREERPISC